MVSFVNFARIASLCVGFHLGTLHGYIFSLRLLAKFEFPARISSKTCLNFLNLYKTKIEIMGSKTKPMNSTH